MQEWESFVRQYYADWARLDSNLMADKYSPSAVMTDPTRSSPIKGRDGIREYYAEMFDSLREPRYRYVEYFGDVTRIVIRWDFSFLEETDARVHFAGLSWKQVENGLITQDLAFWAPDRPSAKPE